MTCAEVAPPPLRARGKAGRGAQFEQERITENYGPLLFGVCIPYGTSATIVQQRMIHTNGFVSTKNPTKTSFTPASLGFCGASPTETEPSHCSFLQTMHRGIHKTVPNLGNKVDFLTFWHELIILRGNNICQIGTWQPVQNSAPILRRLVEKPLKTVLFDQNDYQWPKNRKVA